MLQFVVNAKGRHVIAGIFLLVMLVVIVPLSWLHCHNHVEPPIATQAGLADDALSISPASVQAEEDHCTFCSHAWPGFIASDPIQVIFSPAFGKTVTPGLSPCATRGWLAFTDGRGPPSRA